MSYIHLFARSLDRSKIGTGETKDSKLPWRRWNDDTKKFWRRCSTWIYYFFNFTRKIYSTCYSLFECLLQSCPLGDQTHCHCLLLSSSSSPFVCSARSVIKGQTQFMWFIYFSLYKFLLTVCREIERTISSFAEKPFSRTNKFLVRLIHSFLPSHHVPKIHATWVEFFFFLSLSPLLCVATCFNIPSTERKRPFTHTIRKVHSSTNDNCI